MAVELKKKLSLITTIAVILIISIGGYYLINLKQGPYPASSFISLSYKWGLGDTLVNSYNSATGEYQYLNNKDVLVKTKIKLNANHVIFLHSKANELDLWKLPDVIANPNANLKSDKVLRYEMTFNYERKTKKIIYMTDYNENATIAAEAEQLQKVIAQTINEAEDRYTKP